MIRPLEGMVKGRRFYCKYEGETSQRSLKEYRTERKHYGLNMASRLDLILREARAEQKGRWGTGSEMGRKRNDQERAKERT